LATGASASGDAGDMTVTVGSTDSATGGGAFTLTSGSASAGAGGNIGITAGASDGADGGLLVMAAGSSTAGSGGKATLTGGGSSFATGDGGATEVFGGDSTSQDGGSITVKAGSGSTNGGAMAISGGIGSTGLGGSVSIESGVGTAATSGDATLSTAAGGTAGDSGAMLIQTGTASNGDSGSLTLATGASASGDAGDMTVTVEDSKRSRNSQETESQNLLDMQLVKERSTDTSLSNCSTNSYHPAQDNNLEEKSEVNEFHRYLTEYTKHLHGTRALHLCLRKKSIDGARLILQREMQMGLRGCEGKTSLVLNQLDQRSALHMACAINCEVDVIKLILERDPTRSVTTWTDVTGSTPLHLACAHGDARHEVVKELLEADAKRIKLQTNKTSRKSCVDPSVCKQSIEILDRHNRNPLARAVQENAPTEVLRLFLKPLNFKADGFGEKEISVLARRIKKDITLQREMTAAGITGRKASVGG
jgi:hypothetical protein